MRSRRHAWLGIAVVLVATVAASLLLTGGARHPSRVSAVTACRQGDHPGAGEVAGDRRPRQAEPPTADVIPGCANPADAADAANFGAELATRLGAPGAGLRPGTSHSAPPRQARPACSGRERGLAAGR